MTYSPRPGYEVFHSGSPPGPPPGPPYHPPPHPGHYDQYPPPPPNAGRSASRGLPYGSSRDVHDHHFQRPPRVPPPESPYRPPHYDHYDQHRSGPPPSAPYGRPYSAPPDRYDERRAGPPQGPSYTATHRTPHHEHFEHYPPAPGVDSYYPGPPQTYPPPHSSISRNSSQYGYDSASPARLYPSGYGSPPPGTYSYQSHQYPSSDLPPYHTRYDDRSADRLSYEPQRRDTNPQYPEHRSGENQQNRERHGRRLRYDSPKGRSRSERRFPDQPSRLASPLNSTPPVQSAKDSTSEGSRSKRESSDAVLVNTKNTEKYTAEDLDWEEETIFKELPLKVTRDLIREPLPAEWTDAPMMPPKYDKETITSKYINSTNIDDFALSVRETKAWQVMQFHPAFLAPTDVRIEKLWDYERVLNPGPVYNKQSRHGSNDGSGGSSGRQRGKPWVSRTRGGRQTRYSQHHRQNHSPSEDHLNFFRPGLTKRIWDQTSYRDIEEPGGENEAFGKKPKMFSPEPGEVCESDDQEPTTTNRSASPSWDEEYHHVRQNYQDRSGTSLHDSRISLPGVKSDSDARRSSPQDLVTPPPPPSHISRSPSRASSTHSSHDDGSKPPSRRSSRSNPSQPSSRRSSMASPLTPTERELLGLRPYSSGSDTGRDSSMPQTNGAPTRPRQRPAKLHAAYQRRW
ncbi:hypothetical protein F5Y12DRAFT_239158 [Xylaria sp. FL1777]|nr:hypothetical protein F5Y12DRAFT_239158 [Xylaria sp. FL1777]